MNRKLIIGLSAAAVLAAVIAIFAVVILSNSESETDASQPVTLNTQPVPETTVPATEPVTQPSQTETTVPETTLPVTVPTLPETEPSVPEDTWMPYDPDWEEIFGEKDPETTGPKETRPAEPAVTEPVVTEPPVTQPPVTLPPETEPPAISLPYRVPGSDLEISALNSYDGIFLEDGSDQEVTGIAAIILRNLSDSCLDFSGITMHGQQTDYRFEASGIGPGESVVVMEANMAAAVDQLYDEILAEVARVDHMEMSGDKLKIEETEDGRLRITNLTEEDIPTIRLFYKFYMEDQSMYVGGITYTVKLTDLKAGNSAVVAPSHYAVGSSRVVMAKIYGQEDP